MKPNCTQAIVVDKDFKYTMLMKRLNDPGKGFLSGVGGHIENDETPSECMKREFEEEVGSPIPKDAKLVFLATLEFTDSINHIFGIIFPEIDPYFSIMTEEGPISWYHLIGWHIMDVNNTELAWNGMIPYMINMLKSKKDDIKSQVKDEKIITSEAGTFDLKKELQLDLDGEIVAIDQYENHIQQIDDEKIVDILKEIIGDEKDHKEKLTVLLSELNFGKVVSTVQDDKWITTSPESGSGKHILLDDDGNIIGGNIPKSAQGKNIKEWAKELSENKTTVNKNELNKTGSKETTQSAPKGNIEELKNELSQHIKDYGTIKQLKELNLKLDEIINNKKTSEMSRKGQIKRKEFNEKEIDKQRELATEIIKLSNEDNVGSKNSEAVGKNSELGKSPELGNPTEGREKLSNIFTNNGQFISPVMVKKEVSKNIAKRLKNNQDFKELVANYNEFSDKKETTQSVVSHLIHNWAQTSADNNPTALALQSCAEQEFGLKGARKLELSQSAKNNLDSYSGAYKVFLKAQYDETQDFLSKNGIKSIEVYRGMKDVADVGIGNANIKLQPMSSFSTNFSTAADFSLTGKNSTIVKMIIPAKDILSTAKTGFGCLSEQEIVVLGHDNMTGYSVTNLSKDMDHITEESFNERIKEINK